MTSVSNQLREATARYLREQEEREWYDRLSKDDIHERLGVLRNYIDSGKDLPKLPLPLKSWDRHILLAYAMHVGNLTAARTLMSDEMMDALRSDHETLVCMKGFIPENFSHILDARIEVGRFPPGQDGRCKCHSTRSIILSWSDRNT